MPWSRRHHRSVPSWTRLASHHLQSARHVQRSSGRRQGTAIRGDIDCPHYFQARSEPDIRERLRKYAAVTGLGLRVRLVPGVWRQSLADGALNFMGYRLAAPGGHAPHRLIRVEDRVVARPAVSADEPFGWWVACRRSVDGELARSWGCLLRWAVDDRYVLRPERLFPPASTILGWKNCWAIVAPTVATSPNLPRVPVPQGSNPAPSPRRAVVQ